MALQLQFTTQYGITLTTAYAKVASYSGTKDSITIDVHYFATEAARIAGNPTIHRQAYQWNNEDMNMQSVTDVDGLVAALYTYIKTLPDFAGSTDV